MNHASLARLIALLCTPLLVACSAAVDSPPFPYFDEEGGRVRDMANLLSPEAEKELIEELDKAEAAYGPQIGVVTVVSLHGYAIDDFSLAYANAWGLGHKDRNDGLLLLVAPNERKVRIEVGAGIEETFTNAYCQEVIDKELLPHFREGDMETGILTGVKELIARMRENPTAPANDNAAPLSEAEAA